MDQFTYAERATDWRGNNNIAESIFGQLRAGAASRPGLDRGRRRHRRHVGDHRPLRPLPAPRHPGLRGRPGELGVLPRAGPPATPVTTGRGSRIEGIGRPRVEPSFVPTVVDGMISVPDAASIAAARWCSRVTGRMVGGSTGTALWGALQMVAGMIAEGRSGSVVTLLCDGGERYGHTYYDDAWLARQGIDIAPYTATLEKFADTGAWVEPGA